MFAPVLFLIFNRPDKTQIVFDRIRTAKPARLFIAADGPRENKPGETELCNQTRRIVLDGINWPCEIRTLFRDKNMGCDPAVSSAITWFFEQVEEGIILEDDCLPDLSFFPFCNELLEKYKGNEHVMMISGDNFQPTRRGESSYYFSRYPHTWGWATWRRAWRKYDPTMGNWPNLRRNGAFEKFLPPEIYQRVKKTFDGAFSNKERTPWDVLWFFSCWGNSGLCALPNVNLVSNIDSGGTHMKVYDPFILLPTESILFPLKHPVETSPDNEADRYTQRYIYFRGWRGTLKLIAKYLQTIFRENPKQLPREIKTVLCNLGTEVRNRLKH